MIELDPQAEYELAKLESWHDAVFAKQHKNIDNDTSASRISLGAALEWAMYTDTDENKEYLQSTYIATSKEISPYTNTKMRVSDADKLHVGVVLGDEDLIQEAVDSVKRDLVAEKVDASERGHPVHVESGCRLIRGLSMAGRNDLLHDFVETRGGRTKEEVYTAKLWLAHTEGRDDVQALAEEIVRGETERPHIERNFRYSFKLTEFADATQGLGVDRHYTPLIKNMHLDTGDPGVQLFDALWRFEYPHVGPFTREQLLSEIESYEDRFIDQFTSAVAAASFYAEDPTRASEYFDVGIDAIEDGYECEFNGADTFLRHLYQRSLMIQTLLLMGQRQSAYDLAGTHNRDVYYRPDDPHYAERMATRAKERQLAVLISSLERSEDVDMQQLEEVLRSAQTGMTAQNAHPKNVLSRPPELLQILMIIDRAIEQRQKLLQPADETTLY